MPLRQISKRMHADGTLTPQCRPGLPHFCNLPRTGAHPWPQAAEASRCKWDAVNELHAWHRLAELPMSCAARCEPRPSRNTPALFCRECTKCYPRVSGLLAISRLQLPDEVDVSHQQISAARAWIMSPANQQTASRQVPQARMQVIRGQRQDHH